MKKIIVAIDGLNYKQDTIEFAITMANLFHGRLEGLFLDGHRSHIHKVYSIDSGKAMTDEELRKEEIVAGALRQGAAEEFEEACILHHIPYSIQGSRNIALKELLHESINADLLIIHSGEQFTPYLEIKPPGFLNNLVKMTKCPVMLVPNQFISVN